MTFIRLLRYCLFVALLNSLSVCAQSAVQANDLWAYFKREFVSHDGRVIDIQNAHISHSEGQGYGLLLAVKFNDQTSFKKILRWTQDNLQIRSDGLFAWKFAKADSGKWHVTDENNATDGDLLIAWALSLAFERWRDGEYLKQARRIQQAILEHTLVEFSGRLFLLPAVYGFQHDDRIQLNPSYLVFPAYRSLAKHFSGPWSRLLEDGQWLLQASLHNDLQLPSDWVWLNTKTGRVDQQAQFSAEAIRVWLYSALDKMPDYPGFETWQRFYLRHGHYPDRFDAQALKFEGYAMPGYWAVSARVLQQQGQHQAAQSIFKQAQQKLFNEPPNYYSSALLLLALDSPSVRSALGGPP